MHISERAEKVLEKAQKMIESLNEADAAQSKAKDAIKKSNEDIELARADLEQVSILLYYLMRRIKWLWLLLLLNKATVTPIENYFA